jgi:transposase InsO family protein
VVLLPPVEPGQYTSIRLTEHLALEEIRPSIGTVGDAYDNALMETINGLYKAELVYWEGSWRGADDLELAILGWVDWSRYAGDVRPGRWDRGARATASIGDCSWASHRACFVPLVSLVVS